MSEAKLADESEENLKAIDKNVHVTRIESPVTGVGFPDVDFCIDGWFEAKVELKFSSNGRPPEVRATQVRWFKKRIKAGGEPWIIAKILMDKSKPNEEWLYLLIQGYHIEEIARAATLEIWLQCAHKIIESRFMDTDGWRVFIEAMKPDN